MARFDWFAWHRNYRTDEWIYSLSEAERWAWVAFLSYANETDWVVKKCSVTILAPLLMVSPDTLSSMLESAISSGHILDDGKTLCVKNGLKYRPEKENNTNADRQARHRAKMGGYFKEDVSRRQVWEDASGMCYHCGKYIQFENMELDHIIPISKGGKHELSNVCCSCVKCNRTKSNTMSNNVSNGVSQSNAFAVKTKTETITETNTNTPPSPTREEKQSPANCDLVSQTLAVYNEHRPEGWVECIVPSVWLRQQIVSIIPANKDFDMKELCALAKQNDWLSSGIFDITWFFDSDRKRGRLNFKRLLAGELANGRGVDGKQKPKTGKQRTGNLTPSGADF